MRLVEEGYMRLDVPLATYLPGTPRTWAGVTIRQLLKHVHGLRT
jgi:CubicO group peptidase (beta-lactamase class C family)